MRSSGVESGRRRYRPAFLLVISVLLFGGADAQRPMQFGSPERAAREREDGATSCLRTGLVFERHLPGGNVVRRPVTSSAIYILGGRQDSMGYKCKTAGLLYAEGAAGNILVLHRPGITEYSPALGRNLTNDEWITVKLKEAGVPFDPVEFVPVPPAIFDTFAEAREISGLARSRRISRLVLVSSSHHTKRVWLSFSHFNADNALDIYTYGSEERAGTGELLLERMKLLVYRFIVLPLDRLR